MDVESSPELSPYLLKNVKRTGTVLGVGSFGTVEEVTLNGAPCAGKKMHDVLLQSQNKTKKVLVKKLVDECQLMSELKHPNIVQFFGLYFFEDSKYPMIVMEKLSSNLDATLTSYICMPSALKNMLIQDIAKGLNYLHTQVPPIIHRDLTARNVLLTSSMAAKLADLGNARIIQSHGIPSTLSQMPGTLVYMPPEAHRPSPSYDTSLDMFSFGHLILFILLQEFPGNLLPYTYPDPNNPDRLAARTEVERRKEYMDKCTAKLGKSNRILTLLRGCLSDNPLRRPSAAHILELLLAEEKLEQQVYGQIRRQLDFGHVASNPGSLESSTNKYETTLAQQMLQQIRSGEPMVLDKLEVTKPGFFERDKQGHWEQYVFRIEESTYLKYYGDLKKKPLGEIELSNVTEVKKVAHRFYYPFEVHFDGKNSPWHLRARTGDVRNCWMENILANSSSKDEPISSAKSEYMDVPTLKEQKHKTDRDASGCAMGSNEPMFPPPKYNTCRSGMKLQPHKESPRGDEPVYAEPWVPQKNPKTPDANCIGSNESSISTEYKVPAQLQLYKDFTDEQIEQLVSTFQNILQQRQAVEAEQETGSSTLDGSDGCYDYIDSGDEIEESPPPLPPKKRRNSGQLKSKTPTDHGANQESPEQNSSGKFLSMDPFRERVQAESGFRERVPAESGKLSSMDPFRKRIQAESRRRKSIRAIEKMSAQLSKHMDSLPESDEISGEWTRANARLPRMKKEEDNIPKDLLLSKSAIHNMKLIEAGQFGEVYTGDLASSDGVKVTIKRINNIQSFKREMISLSKIMHPNIIRFYGFITCDNMMVFEFVPNGNLHIFLQQNPRPVRKLIKFMNDIVMGMHHLSDLGLVHKDLAARNILVSEKELCKVAGLEQMIQLPKDGGVVQVSDISKTQIRWCAPEYLKEGKCSIASEVWSFGMLMWEMAHPGRQPFDNFSNDEVRGKIKAGYSLTIPCDYPNGVQKMMKLCWSFEPEKRPSFFFIHWNLNRVNFNAR